MNALEGSNADLHCLVKSSPEARIQWSRAGKMLRSDDKYEIVNRPHAKHHHNTTTLRIKGVNKDDLGRYGCHAENAQGRNDVNISLIYEPEGAIFNGCRITENLRTVVCKWSVRSAQSLSEANMFYKQAGDRQWLSNKVPSEINREDEASSNWE